MRSPLFSITSIKVSFSSSEPSHQCTRSGWVSRATSSTQRFNASSLLMVLLPWAACGLMIIVRAISAARCCIGSGAIGLSGNQCGDHVFDIVFELGVIQARHAELQRQLQKADVGGVSQARALCSGALVHAQFAIGAREKLQT